MPNHPADLQLFSRAEVAQMLGLPYRRVIRAFAKRGQQYVTLTLRDVYESGLEGQGEWVLADALEPVAYRPLPGVIVRPGVSFGRPCLEGTSIDTAFVASRVRGGESVAEVAQDYGIDEQLVRAAVEFEGQT